MEKPLINPSEVDDKTPFDSDAIIKKGLDIFDLPGPTGEIGPTGPTDETGVLPPQPEPEPEPTGPIATGPTGPPTPTAAPSTGVPKDYRFKSHDEAEKGYKSQQQYVTELELKSKTLAKELSDVKTKHELEKKAEEREKRETEAFIDFVKQRTKEKIEALENLDTDDENYKDKVAEIESNFERDKRNFKYEDPEDQGDPIPPSPDKSSDMTITGTEGTSEKPEHTELVNPDKLFEAQQETLNYIEKFTKDSGLDSDNAVFRYYANKAPSRENGEIIPLDKQIKWAIDQTRAYTALQSAESPNIKENDPVFMHYNSVAPIKDANGNIISIGEQAKWVITETLKYHSENISKIVHDKEAPLGKGPIKPDIKKSETLEPFSLSDAVEAAEKKRVI